MQVPVFIEIPKGSRNKYELDKEKNVIKFDRMLFSSVMYPTDYGFIPDTLADDGDALDAMVILGEPTFPGCYIETKVLGVLVMSDDKGLDEKILTVPVSDPQWNHLNCLEDVPKHLLNEIAHFFQIYKNLENKEVKILGWKNKEEAILTIKKCYDFAKK